MSFHGGLVGVLVALALFAPPRQAHRRRVRLRRSAAGDRVRRRPHRQLHQRRAVGQAHRRALGARRGRRGAARLAALRGVARRPGAVRDPVVVPARPRPRLAPRGCSCSCYGVFRFAVEFVRVPDAQPRLPAVRLADDGSDPVAADDRRRDLCMLRGRLRGAASRPATTPGHAPVPRPDAPRARARRAQGRPHRHRHAGRVRLADALRPRRRASRWSPPRSCTCGRSCTSCCGSCRARPTSRICASTVSRSGTSGPTSTASSGRCTARSGARGRRRRPHHRSDRGGRGLSCKRDPHSRRIIVSAWNVGELDRDGAGALPRAVPVLRRRRPAVVPALPAQRRHLPRRALQHRLLCAADAHAGAAVRPGAGRVHLDRRRLPPVPQSPGAGRCSSRASRCRCRS